MAYLGANPLTNDQFIHTSKLSTTPPGRDDVEWRNEAVAKWPGLRSEFGGPYFPHVSIDWDNTPRFKAQRPVALGSTPAKFKAFLQQAKADVDAQPPVRP